MLNVDLFTKRRITEKMGFYDIIDAFIEKIQKNELLYDNYSKQYSERLREEILEGKIIVTTPMLFATQGLGAYSSCSVIDIDLNQKYEELFKQLNPFLVDGKGLGFSLDKTDNPVFTFHMLNEIFMNTETNVKRMAGMATLDIEHPSAPDFIKMKMNSRYDDYRFNISVMVSSSFMQAAIDNPDGKEKRLLHEVSDSIHNCSEPGVLFSSRISRDNPLPGIPYESVSPCAEIAMAKGEECVFGYLNLNSFVDKNNKIDYIILETAVSDLLQMLDNVIDISMLPNSITSRKRRVGIGYCGLADIIAKNGYRYGSAESLELVRNICSWINYYAKKKSIQMARQRGAFKLYPESRYLNRNWFLRFYHENTDESLTNHWIQLWEELCTYGIRNCSMIAIPPTANSSRFVGASYSIEPFFNLRDCPEALGTLVNMLKKKNIDSEEILHHIEEFGHVENINLCHSIKEIFRTKRTISYMDELLVTTEVQKQIDESISKTITVPYDSDVDHILHIILESYRLGLKGIALHRNPKNTVDLYH